MNIAVWGAGEIVNSGVRDVAQLGRYITGLRVHLQETDSTGHPLPGLFVLETVRKATVAL